ncbi:MAG: alcohol dehydrogenase [Comamonadaceae bacterium CG2_30_60_41]|nr:MAG: alcohol dehydrogenase [Comamonadaceae bacterium CG2_30_60_41]
MREVGSRSTCSQATMKAVVTVGVGDFSRLVHKNVSLPVPGPGEVLLEVLASSVNNTDINTRLGWYDSADSTEVSAAASTTADTTTTPSSPQTGWNGATLFPLIQGTDCCGRVVGLAPGVDQGLMGRRVLVRPCMRPLGFQSWVNRWLGSDMNGAFAQFVSVPATEVFPVDSDWSDTELGVVPCAYGTAENMLQRVQVRAGEHVLVTGASGGVGVAAMQLAKCRGAVVSAITSPDKMAQLQALGADRVLQRRDDVKACLGKQAVDVVVDNVAGNAFAGLLPVLKSGGRYVSSGAVAGPIVSLDMRMLYLNNLTLYGCTAWDASVFPQLMRYIRQNAFHPVIAATFTLKHIEQAQRAFLKKQHIGKIALLP